MAKPWLKRNFNDGTLFRMPLAYLVNHLSPYDKNKVYGRENPLFENWQSKKEKGICGLLNKRIKPSQLPPIRMNIHPTREEFYVSDGISRIRAFRKKGIKNINTILGHY